VRVGGWGERRSPHGHGECSGTRGPHRPAETGGPEWRLFVCLPVRVPVPKARARHGAPQRWLNICTQSKSPHDVYRSARRLKAFSSPPILCSSAGAHGRQYVPHTTQAEGGERGGRAAVARAPAEPRAGEGRGVLRHPPPGHAAETQRRPAWRKKRRGKREEEAVISQHCRTIIKKLSAQCSDLDPCECLSSRNGR